jgi:hypothetical protein
VLVISVTSKSGMASWQHVNIKHLRVMVQLGGREQKLASALQQTMPHNGHFSFAKIWRE